MSSFIEVAADRWGIGKLLRHPAQYVVATFVGATLVGTSLLLLPFATQGAGGASPLTALFTATSAVCVTGLTVVDTGTYWSGFGQGVILLLIQVGGLGIMTLSALLVMILSRRLGMRQRVIAAAATGTPNVGDVRELLHAIVRLTLCVEGAAAVVLFLRFWLTHDESVGDAAYLGVFHAVSAFNNAGFSVFSDNLIGFRTDLVLLLVVAASVVIGGLGFPVWLQLTQGWRSPRRWDLHTKVTLSATVGLIAVGWLLFTWFEWTNPATLGGLSTPQSIVNGLFHSISPRTAGFNTIDMAQMNEPTRLLTEVLMFIGGGSGSTAGGIKVGTFALLGWVVWSEVRGEPDVVVFDRRVPTSVQRQALTVALIGIGTIVVSTMVLLATTELPRSDLLFETVSALGTVGLSTGATPLLTGRSQIVVVVLMLLGRVGPPTLFTALVLRERRRLYREAEERIIIG